MISATQLFPEGETLMRMLKELSNGGVRCLGQRLWSALSTLDSTRLGASANILVFGWNTREIPPRSECQMKRPLSL